MTAVIAGYHRRLQPRLRGRHALLPGLDLVGVLERQPDVVEAFEQTRAVGGRDVEGDVAARPGR